VLNCVALCGAVEGAKEPKEVRGMRPAGTEVWGRGNAEKEHEACRGQITPARCAHREKEA